MELFSIQGVIEYEPDVYGNRDQPKGKRCVVELEPLSAAALRKADEAFGSQLGGAPINFVRKANEVRAAVLEQAVKRISGLWLNVERDGKSERVAIEDAAGLIEHAPEILLDDIYGALKNQSRLSEQARGN